MELTKELFVIPEDKNFILYAPLQNVAIRVNPAAIKVLQDIKQDRYSGGADVLVDTLRKRKILLDNREEIKICSNTGDFAPTSVTLLPTSDCNLRCSYCYSSAGEVQDYMPFEVAKASIDFIIGNAIKLNQKKLSLGFHGGGEPFCHFDLVQRALEYTTQKAKENGLNVNCSSVSNGILGKDKLEWIVKNLSHINLSLDGTEDIQNSQRPLKNGGASFDIVMNTIKYFEEKKFHYGIRSTITNLNVGKMKEMIDFFTSELPSIKGYHFEPVFECGRCAKTGTKEPSSELFLDKLIEAKEHAQSLGKGVYYSGGRLGTATNSFCGAAGKNFFVMPNGRVISCLETSSFADQDANIFCYGKFENSKFEFDGRKLDYLKTRVVENIPHCVDCFVKYNCAGDCLAKVHSQGDMFDTSNNRRCEINRGILLHDIKKLLDNPQGYEKNDK